MFRLEGNFKLFSINNLTFIDNLTAIDEQRLNTENSVQRSYSNGIDIELLEHGKFKFKRIFVRAMKNVKRTVSSILGLVTYTRGADIFVHFAYAVFALSKGY